jgi:hypothetical protein
MKQSGSLCNVFAGELFRLAAIRANARFAAHRSGAAHVSYGSFASFLPLRDDVRFTLDSDRIADMPDGSPKSARDPTYRSVDEWGEKMWGKVKEPRAFPEAPPIRIERFFLNK